MGMKMTEGAQMLAQMTGKDGFIAALDQSGGSTPAALRLYGISDTEYGSEDEMYRLMHEMRVRIMTAPASLAKKSLARFCLKRRWMAMLAGSRSRRSCGKIEEWFRS
jgi:fructose-bisphosphate aldolase class 1